MKKKLASGLDERATGAGSEGDLERGRVSYERRDWTDAYASLSSAD